jgi:hypothetical protein
MFLKTPLPEERRRTVGDDFTGEGQGMTAAEMDVNVLMDQLGNSGGLPRPSEFDVSDDEDEYEEGDAGDLGGYKATVRQVE